jgi:integrase
MARKLLSLREQAKNYHQIRFRTPGWESGRFEMSSGSTDRKVMEAYRSKLQSLYQEGRFDVLAAVKARRISLPTLKQVMDEQGVAGAVAHLKQLEREREERSVDLAPLVTQYLEDPNRTASDRTFALYKDMIDVFIAYVDAEINGPVDGKKAKQGGQREPVTLRHLTRDWASKWVRYLEQRPSIRYPKKGRLTPKTVVHHRAALSAFASWLVEKGHLEVNPVQSSYRPKLVKEEPTYMTREQWQLFRAESELYDAEREMPRQLPETLFYRWLVATGATTFNEGCRATTRDIHINKSPTSTMVPVWLGGTKNGNRQRTVFIARSLAEELIAYAKKWNRKYNEPVFPFLPWEGQHWFGKVRDRLVKKGHAEFAEFRPYDLRHTYAVHMVQGDPERNVPGVDIVTLARLMGHGDNIQTTMIYARHVGDYAARGCAVLHETLGLS